jgi:hypothetical protein
MKGGRGTALESAMIAPEKLAEVVLKPPLPVNRGKVDVVISRHDSRLAAPGGSVEQSAGLLVFALQRQVRDVAGHHQMVGRTGRRFENPQQVLPPVHPSAAKMNVRPAGDPLVQQHLTPADAPVGEDVEIGDVCDSKHRSSGRGSYPLPVGPSKRYGPGVRDRTSKSGWLDLPSRGQ